MELSLDLRAASQHLVQARLRWTPSRSTLAFRLPAWTPGSYLIRDYIRLIEGLELRQAGRTLRPQRSAPAAWRLELESLEPLELRYAAMATELTVRTCHLDGDHAFLALAALAFQVEGHRWTPHRLRLSLPEGWEPFVPLPGDPAEGWLAAGFDELVDTPVEAGPHTAHGFSVGDVPHRWVCWEAGGDAPSLLRRHPSLLEDVRAVCAACCRLMGESAPAAPDYLFVLHLLDQGYGGLEHDRSSVLQYGRQALARPEGYRKLLQLVGHEYLHQWNVRRLRPAELTPIDYDRPVIVPSLWFAEGVTSYLDLLLPHLAGLSDEEALWEDLGADLSRYLLTPGRLAGQSLRQSSEEAWVKLYRREAYSDDNQVSYYLKGAVIALTLDLELHRNGSCLVAVLRDLWQRLGRWGRGYGEADLLEAFVDRAPLLRERLPQWLEGHGDPELASYLADVALVLEPVSATRPSMGLRCGAEARGLIVQRVERHGPAQRAGLQVGDELIALDGRRLRQSEDLLDLLQQEQTHRLTVCRWGLLRDLSLAPAPPMVERWQLRPATDPSPEALERRRRWLALVPA